MVMEFEGRLNLINTLFHKEDDLYPPHCSRFYQLSHKKSDNYKKTFLKRKRHYNYRF